jgi:histo-blood group ABO system transferase
MAKHKIGLLVICLGKYDIFLPPLVKSVEKYFLTNHDVTVFCFTDKDLPSKKGRINIVKVPVDPERYKPFFPYATLKRYHMFAENKESLKDMDYLYYCDVDMLFASNVEEEVLPDTETGLTGTEHPGFFGGRRGTYETNVLSEACVKNSEGKTYFAGGFNGGTREAFLAMSEHIKNKVDMDANKNIMAIWHDESHMNRYFIDHPPKMLSPAYCFPESWAIPFEKKLLALDKNHAEIRK